MDIPIRIALPDNYLNEEIRNNYTITKEYKELWSVELDLLFEFDRICRLHGIQYWACGGTMLGAVRHKGFIPWDDDIDIMMLRDDYEKLCCVGNEFQHPYFFQTEYTDPGSMRGHAQLRNSLTTGALQFDLEGKFKFNQGIFIDIFPLDNIPDEETAKTLFYRKLNKKRVNMQRIRDIPAHPDSSESKIKNAIRKAISPIIKLSDVAFASSHIMYKRYESYMKKYNGTTTKEVGIMSLLDLGDRYQWDKKDLNGQSTRVPFEFIDIPIPSGYQNMLKKTYGEWEKPIKAGSVHGDLIFNTRLPYDEYIARHV